MKTFLSLILAVVACSPLCMAYEHRDNTASTEDICKKDTVIVFDGESVPCKTYIKDGKRFFEIKEEVKDKSFKIGKLKLWEYKEYNTTTFSINLDRRTPENVHITFDEEPDAETDSVGLYWKPMPNAGEVSEIMFEESASGPRISDSFKNVRAFQLDSDAGKVDGIRRIIEAGNSNILLVLTENKIFAFDKYTGRFSHMIGEKGAAPDNYSHLSDMYYDAKEHTVNVIDDIEMARYRYTLAGEFIGKEEFDFPWVTSVTHSGNGYMMISHMMTGGNLVPPSEYAFTVVAPDGKSFPLDSFAPVKLKGNYGTDFAAHPATVTGNRFTFFKFLNDTIYNMENGKVWPSYKLSLKKKMAPKEVVAETGDIITMWDGKYFPGFNDIYETSGFIVLVPWPSLSDAYYWIDKTNGYGIRYSSNNMKSVLSGERIFNIKGSDSRSLICAFSSQDIDSAQKCLTKKTACFSDEVKAVFKNADDIGNPVVVIYSH